MKPVLPPVVWVGAKPGYSVWEWTGGLMAARKAGVALQILVVAEGAPVPELRLRGSLEVVTVQASDLLKGPAPGMLGSFQLGLEALGDRLPGPVFLALAARPAAAGLTYAKLVEGLRASEGAAAKPRVRGKHGHPVLLGAERRSEARGLDPEFCQVRDLLMGAVSVDVDDPGVLGPGSRAGGS